MRPAPYNLALNAASTKWSRDMSASGVPLNGNDARSGIFHSHNSCLQDLIVEVKQLFCQQSIVVSQSGAVPLLPMTMRHSIQRLRFCLFQCYAIL